MKLSRPSSPIQMKAGFFDSKHVFLINPRAEKTFAISYNLLIYSKNELIYEK